jgi:hypothetical protein
MWKQEKPSKRKMKEISTNYTKELPVLKTWKFPYLARKTGFKI